MDQKSAAARTFLPDDLARGRAVRGDFEPVWDRERCSYRTVSSGRMARHYQRDSTRRFAGRHAPPAGLLVSLRPALWVHFAARGGPPRNSIQTTLDLSWFIFFFYTLSHRTTLLWPGAAGVWNSVGFGWAECVFCSGL
ncbi:hypothetical protein B0H10DRAFT_2434779 [Mycena sp. CBHHK59/15]|nr:hypothetical protein B0H10DRAFT_2434779 [Mycena sp. CBHHK59/15]